MKEYWNGIKISDIKNINKCGYNCNLESEEKREYFTIEMKDGSKHTLHYIFYDKSRKGNNARRELKQILNERDNTPEIYYLYTEIYGNINGQSIVVGYEAEDNLDEYKYFTLNEIEELNKQFKIGDKGIRSLVYIQIFTIEENKIKFPIEQRWLDQLTSLGYDISKLEYKLKLT